MFNYEYRQQITVVTALWLYHQWKSQMFAYHIMVVINVSNVTYTHHYFEITVVSGSATRAYYSTWRKNFKSWTCLTVF